MSAQTWTNAPSVPPSNNVPAPIHKSENVASSQWGYGSLGFDDLVAYDQTRSQEYCDLSGLNCFTPVEVTNALPVCSEGQTLVAESTGAWVCGDSIPTPPPTVWLVNNLHSERECQEKGGVITVDGADSFCRISASACPLGWTKFEDWDAYTARTTDPCGYGGTNSCRAPAQAWANTTNVPSDSIWCGTNANFHHSSTQYCTAQVSSIGCY